LGAWGTLYDTTAEKTGRERIVLERAAYERGGELEEGAKEGKRGAAGRKSAGARDTVGEPWPPEAKGILYSILSLL